jgi:hypothetical protein
MLHRWKICPLLLAQLALLCLLPACRDAYDYTRECPPCPNNTQCIEGDCGCPPDKHDMGNWCLSKSDNLFVAASLDCYCFQVVGLYLWNLVPETGGGGVQVPASAFSLVGPGSSQGGYSGNFAYFERPDGDSISIFKAPMPYSGYPTTCHINDALWCEADIFGKFRGPDTIQAKVVWRRCRDNNDNWNAFTSTKPLTFVRWK